MKKLVLTLTAIGFSASVFAQTMLTLDNLSGAGTATATSAGLFFNLDGTAYTGDLKLTVLGGASAGSLTPIASNLTMLYSGTPGVYLDTTFATYNVAGVAAGAPAILQVQPWRGAATSFAAAAGADQFYAWSGSAQVRADQFTFTNPTGGGGQPPGPPKSLDGMPAMQLAVPEPSSIALAGLGAAALLMYRRRKA